MWISGANLGVGEIFVPLVDEEKGSARLSVSGLWCLRVVGLISGEVKPEDRFHERRSEGAVGERSELAEAKTEFQSVNFNGMDEGCERMDLLDLASGDLSGVGGGELASNWVSTVSGSFCLGGRPLRLGVLEEEGVPVGVVSVWVVERESSCLCCGLPIK